MEYNIRLAKIEDFMQIQKVAKTSWNTTYAGIIPVDIQENFIKAAYSEDMLKRRIENSLFLIAEVMDEIVGFANFSPVRGEGEVELGAIYLYSEYQGSGIGTQLLKQGIEQSAGVKKVFINVEKDNEIGKIFYKAKGFEVVSEFDDNFDGHILKTIRMVLQI